MARIRSIKPEFWRSPSTAKASPRARLLYIAMWNWADDYGIGEWTPRELLGFAFPNDMEIGSAEFQSLCTEVAACFDTVFYVIDGRRFYCIPAWDDHQKNERRAQGKYPRPDDPNSAPDPLFSDVTEMRGVSVRAVGDSASGTGNREQGTGEQGKKEQVARLAEEAYESWPKKVERKAALEKFNIAAKRFGDPEGLLTEVKRFAAAYAATTERNFIPALNVWLSHERWTDDLPAPKLAASTRTQENLSVVALYAEQEKAGITA